MTIAYKIFNPSEIVIQSGLVGQKILEADQAAEAARAAAEKAHDAKERQRIIAEATSETYEVAGRLRLSMFPHGNHVIIPSSADGKSRRTSGIMWSLTEDGRYGLVLTDRHELFIAKIGMNQNDLSVVDFKEFVELELSVLTDINDHLKNLGVNKTVQVLVPEISNEEQKAYGRDESVEKVNDTPTPDLDASLPDPDIYTADPAPLAYAESERRGEPDVGWHAGAAPSR